MFKRTSWMSAVHIAQAVSHLRTVAECSFNKDEQDAALEGIACLKGAKPEYLTNLIPQDHPDRKAAVRLLTE